MSLLWVLLPRECLHISTTSCQSLQFSFLYKTICPFANLHLIFNLISAHEPCWPVNHYPFVFPSAYRLIHLSRAYNRDIAGRRVSEERGFYNTGRFDHVADCGLRSNPTNLACPPTTSRRCLHDAPHAPQPPHQLEPRLEPLLQVEQLPLKAPHSPMSKRSNHLHMARRTRSSCPCN